MEELPLRLERYFFPHQEVRANPAHERGGKLHNQVNVNAGVGAVEGRKGAFAIDLTISLDEDKSENPPYFFTINAFGILVAEGDSDIANAQELARLIGSQLLIGAARERLADLTARGPWGQFLLNLVRRFEMVEEAQNSSSGE
jgi:preprotein translocase subunit SecB